MTIKHWQIDKEYIPQIDDLFIFIDIEIQIFCNCAS